MIQSHCCCAPPASKLPVNDLAQWMKGAVKTAHQTSRTLDDANRLSEVQLLDSSGQVWTLSYSSYEPVQGYYLPGRVKLSSNQITITIKISDWELTGV